MKLSKNIKLKTVYNDDLTNESLYAVRSQTSQLASLLMCLAN